VLLGCVDRAVTEDGHPSSLMACRLAHAAYPEHRSQSRARHEVGWASAGPYC
jgi:hypothetical protein